MLLSFNLNELAPLLESEKSLTKQEFLQRFKPAIDTGKEKYKKLCQLITQLQFFSITLSRSGQVLII
jgi:hypothetical protein